MADIEKNTLEHIETRETDVTDSPPSEHPLEKQETLQSIDLANHQAFKGDESDGKVDWTPRKLIAAACLAMLYTGTSDSPL